MVRARDRVAAVNKDAQRAVGRIIYCPGSSCGRQRYSNGDRDVKVSTSYGSSLFLFDGCPYAVRVRGKRNEKENVWQKMSRGGEVTSISGANGGAW